MTSGNNASFFRWSIHGQPRVRFAGWFPFGPEIASGSRYKHPTVALHQHFYHGRLVVEGGATFLLRPGDVTYSLPNVVTQYELDAPGHHWCIHFNSVEDPRSGVLRLPLHLPMGAAGAYITERMRAIADLQGRLQRAPSDGLLKTAVSLSLQELIVWTAVSTHGNMGVLGPKSEAAVCQARALLDERFNEPLTIQEITSASGLSRNYLATRFRQRFGITMEGYLLRRRIEVARQLLLTTDLQIKEVAFRVGIPDPQYFNKQFRRMTGVSPLGFRSSFEKGEDW